MDNNKILVIEQVKDLQMRTKSVIRSGSGALTYSLTMEYLKLIASSIGNTGSNQELLHELLLLYSESSTIPPKSKDDPLVQLKWLDNSISKLKMLVQKLSPITTNLEIKLHPKVLKAAEQLFQDGHYAEAVFAALKALEEYVREKSGRNEYGEYLMSSVFSENNPILKIKYSRPDTATDEQKGFRFIFMGAMTGIKNPKGHHTIIQRDRARTLQYLALASLLFKIADDATLVQNADVKEKVQ